MTDASFTKPTVVQDFAVVIQPEDVDDRNHTKRFLEEIIWAYYQRFRPQVSPGKRVNITIRMETEA